MEVKMRYGANSPNAPKTGLSSYYGTYSVRGVGVGITTSQVAFTYPAYNPLGETPTGTVNSGAMTGVGNATSVAWDTTRTNAYGIGILLNHSGITVGRAYYCLANITVDEPT